MNYKRQIKRENLIKELFKIILNDTIEKDYQDLIEFRITDEGICSNCESHYYNRNDKIPYKIIIELNLNDLILIAKKGLNNNYYYDRWRKTFFLIGNRHLTLRFVLLHELKHAYQHIHHRNFVSEFEADNHAISKLQQRGEIRNGKTIL